MHGNLWKIQTPGAPRSEKAHLSILCESASVIEIISRWCTAIALNFSFHSLVVAEATLYQCLVFWNNHGVCSICFSSILLLCHMFGQVWITVSFLIHLWTTTCQTVLAIERFKSWSYFRHCPRCSHNSQTSTKTDVQWPTLRKVGKTWNKALKRNHHVNKQ